LNAEEKACLRFRWKSERPAGIPLPELTMDEFMGLEDGVWSRQEDRI
jgi:hypothetical protein